MRAVLRTGLATVIGMAVAFALILAVEAFGAVVHPMPPGAEESMEAVCRHVESYPAWVLAAVVPMWSFAALASAWTAARIGNRVALGVVGLLLVAALMLNLSMLPYPIWFKAANLVAIPAAIFLATRLSGRRRPLAPAGPVSELHPA